MSFKFTEKFVKVISHSTLRSAPGKNCRVNFQRHIVVNNSWRNSYCILKQTTGEIFKGFLEVNALIAEVALVGIQERTRWENPNRISRAIPVEARNFKNDFRKSCRNPITKHFEGTSGETSEGIPKRNSCYLSRRISLDFLSDFPTQRVEKVIKQFLMEFPNSTRNSRRNLWNFYIYSCGSLDEICGRSSLWNFWKNFQYSLGNFLMKFSNNSKK